MMVPIVTILIPTRNRNRELCATLNNIIQIIGGNTRVEILVSDNSDFPVTNLPNYSKLKVIRPEIPLDTAEENFFFALGQASGDYIWPLGDDDIVRPSALRQLLTECEIGRFDAMVWNTRNVSGEYEAVGWSRVRCNSGTLQISYRNFLERIGYWSIPAGISLTVFKRKLIKDNDLKLVEALKSKIYSHVTFYALAFKECKFAFINSDLVEYRTNSYDLSHSETDHWTNYSSKQNLSDHYFWLKGFVEHLNLLEQQDAIEANFLGKSIDIGHFNHRLPLLEHMINMIIKQVSEDLIGKSKIEINQEEFVMVMQYITRFAPEYEHFLGKLKQIKFEDTINDKSRLEQLEILSKNWSEENWKYPYRRFFDSRVGSLMIFDTPLGWIALPEETNSCRGDVPQIKWLEEVMYGIEYPPLEGVYIGQNKEDLFTAIQLNTPRLSSLEFVSQFQLVPAGYKSSISRANNQTLLRRFWNLLPLKMKIKIKQKLIQ